MIEFVVLVVLLLTVFPKMGTDYKPREKPKEVRARDKAYRKDKRDRAMANNCVREDKDGNTYINSKAHKLYPIIMKMRFFLRPRMRVRGGFREFRLLRTRLFAGRRKITLPLAVRYWDFLSYKHIGRPLYVPVLFVLCLMVYIAWVHYIGDIIGMLGVFPIAGMALGGLNHPQIAVVENATPNTEITAAVALGAKEIHFDPTITYTVSAAITDDLSDTVVDGHGCVINNSAGNNYIFEFANGIGTDYALTENTAIGDVTITVGVVNIVNFSVDDIVEVYDDTTLGAAKRGETMRVRSVDAVAGTFDTFEGCAYAYLTASNAKTAVITTQDNVTFKNLIIYGQGSAADEYVFEINSFRNLKIQNCEMHECGKTALALYYAYSVIITGCSFSDTAFAGLGYGIAVVNGSRYVNISGCNFQYCRHGITHSNDNTHTLCFDTTTTGCLFSQCSSAGWDTHEATGYSCVISGSAFDTCWYGAQCRSSNSSIETCHFNNIGFEDIGGLHGSAIQLYLGNNISACNNTINNVYRFGIYTANTTGQERTSYLIANNNIGTCEMGICANYTSFSVFTGNNVHNTSDDGINLYYCSACNTSGNFVYTSASDGIHLYAYGVDSVCSNNMVQTCTTYGIYIYSTGTQNIVRTCTVNANRIYVASDTAIYFERAPYSVISNNSTVSGNYGIYIKDADYCSIISNTITNVSVMAIYIHATCDTTTISLNNMLGCAAAKRVSDNGTNTIYPAKEILIPIFDSDEDCAIGDGTMGIGIGSELNAWTIKNVRASVYTKGVTGTMDIQIRRVRAGATVDVLSTLVTVGDEYTVADGVINAANDDLATGDLLFVDVDTTHTTPAKGLSIIIKCGEI